MKTYSIVYYPNHDLRAANCIRIGSSTRPWRRARRLVTFLRRRGLLSVTHPSRSPHVSALLGQSGSTYLLLCCQLGPRRAFVLLNLIALGAMWLLLCRRYPLVGVFTCFVFFAVIGRRNGR